MIGAPDIMSFRCFFHCLLVFLPFVCLAEGKFLVNDNSWKNCMKGHVYPISIKKFENVPFEKSKRVFEINGTMTTPLLATLEVSYCSLKDHPDACSQEVNEKYLLTCQGILAKNKPWSAFFASFEPKLECPIKSGEYTSNAPPTDFWKIPESFLKEVRPGLYQVRYEVMHRYGELLCWDIEYEIKQMGLIQKVLSTIM